MPISIQIASGTEAEWAQETIPLGVGEPGWATDSELLAIGDGNTLWAGLGKFSAGQGTSVVIDDSQANLAISGRSDATLSSQAIISLVNSAIAKAAAYTDNSVKTVGSPRVVPVIQNSDGSWPTTTGGTTDMTIYSGTVGVGVAPNADQTRDFVILRDPS